MVVALLNSLKGFLKIPTVVIDNGVFRLHYRVTVAFLAAASLLVTATQYFGDPISCETITAKADKDVIESFCWSTYTHSTLESFEKNPKGKQHYPGTGEGETIVYHTYYQWVAFVLFLEACGFYLPRLLWKVWEGGRVKSLVQGLDNCLLSVEDKNTKKTTVVGYFCGHCSQHRFYGLKYCISEALNFINVIVQIYALDAFLGGEFRKFGVNVINHALLEDYDKRTDPMVRVFPRLTRCLFTLYGGETLHNCVLPLNVINEKIFVFAWFWFVILATVTGLLLVYRIAVMFSPSFRAYVMKAQSPYSNPKVVDELSHTLSNGDWFLLYLLGKNIDPNNFSEVIEDLNDLLSNNEPLMNENSSNSLTLPNYAKRAFNSFSKQQLVAEENV